MKITIEFDSIWQNSFLEGNDGDGKRKFKATSKNSDIVHKQITKDTILGVLSRLIGDQRKLYQAKASDNYYFKDIENLILEPIVTYRIEWAENVYLINKSESRPPQSAYIGTIKKDERLFFSESSTYLWSILYMGLNEIIEFILSDAMSKKKVLIEPDDLLKRINLIQNFEILSFTEDEILNIKEKLKKKEVLLQKKVDKYNSIAEPSKAQTRSIENTKKKFEEELEQSITDIKKISKDYSRQERDKKIKKVLNKLSKKYPKQIYYDKGKLYPMRLYAVALYIQLERMKEEGYETKYFLTAKGSIQGFSKTGFNGVRDFFNKIAGNHKKTVGTPYVLTKASGILEIIIDIPREKAKELKKMIDNAGVSSFYLGKKGLAYVTNISTREVKS